MKRFDYEGCCPECESTNITIHELAKAERPLNNPKSKSVVKEIVREVFRCNQCSKKFDRTDLKYSDIILYYK